MAGWCLQKIRDLSMAVLALLLVACGGSFEPDLSGWQANTQPGRQRMNLWLDGREKAVDLPGDKSINYRFIQWTKTEDQLLIVQTRKTNACYDYRLVLIDTTGSILDTVYAPPPNTLLNFRLAPNDSLLLLKTYIDLCDGDPYRFRFTFMNRFTREMLPDSLTVTDAAGIPLRESVWSPDSRKVIIPAWSGLASQAFVYDLDTKDTTWVDTGTNFLWSPSDGNLITYIKNHSLYGFNLETGEKEVLYEGKKKRSVTEYRWNPTGTYLMIFVRGYLLNIEAPPLGKTNIIYYSPTDERESEAFLSEKHVDTWRVSPAIKADTLRP
jgi:WD40 repeat protein